MPDSATSYDLADDDLDVRGIFRFLVRRGAVIFGVAAFIAGTCFAAGMLQPPSFSAVASVMIVAPDNDVVSANNGAAGPDFAFVESQVEILGSPRVIGRLVDRLNLKNDPAWNPYLRPLAPWEAQLQAWNVMTPWRPSRPLDRAALIEKADHAVSVRRKGRSNVIEITTRAPRPTQAAEMAKIALDSFIEIKTQQRIDADRRANEWLSERLRSLKAEVELKEQAEEAYKAKSGLLAADGSLLTEQQIVALQSAIASARADVAERQARLHQVDALGQAGSSVDSIDNSINSATIRQLREKEADVIQRQADLQSRYGDAHPAIAQVQKEREGIEGQITSEIARIAVNVRNEADVARARLAALEATQSSLQRQIADDNTQSVKLRELARESAATRSIYEQFLARYQQMTETESLKKTDAYPLTDDLLSAHPSGPQPAMLAVLSAIIGLLVGTLVAILVDISDDSIVSAEAMERKLGLAALASIPFVRRRELRRLAPAERLPPRYLVESPMSAFAEGLRCLCATILYALNGDKAKVVCITSALPNEGKTTTSLCLARTAALSGRRAIIIDCDLRRRSLSGQLEIKPTLGLLDCILNEHHWRDVVVDDDVTSLHILPVSEDVFTPRDVFGSEAMRGLLQNLRSYYDLIVLDCPPVLAIAETGLICRLADQTIVVARWSKTPVTAVKRAVERVQKSGGAVSGLALNCVDANARGKLSYLDIAYQTKYAGKYYAS